jgi:hypothetical protein
MKTPVLFRVWRSGRKDVFALFPFEPATREPHTCMSYASVGQHSNADLAGCVRNSRPATPTELRPLLCELRRVGYEPRILKRTPRNAYAARVEATR